MAPPAKRRRRNPLDDSDDGDDRPRTNTLANYLVSSPGSPTKSRVATASPSPVKARAAASTAASPARARRARPQKGGDGAEDGQKARTPDLKTLFSRQAQRAAGAPDKRSAPVDDISDPISEDDVSELRASSSSVVGQHARKRLRKGADAAPAPEAPGASQRFLRPPRPAASDALDDDLRPWAERFGPRNLDELAVHHKKVADVRRWLDDVMAGRLRQRLLVLKGAAGSGKTTTVRLLAQDMGCELLEWKNPTAASNNGFVSTSAQFDDFLGRGGKFGTLDTDGPATCTPRSSNGAAHDGSKRIILIEEFPNTFSRSSSALASFRNSLLGYLAAHTPSLSALGNRPQKEPVKPVVLVISETLLTTTSASADSLTAHRLLGPEILRHPGAAVIEFNPVAPSLLAKALELVVQKEARKSGRRRTPGPQVVKRLGEVGDMRSAISSLEFLCLKGDGEADWGAKVTFTRPKKGVREGIGLTRGERETLELVTQREASLGIFHAVGKVVYNKRDEAPPPGDAVEHLPPFLARFARPRRSQVAVDALIDETGTDTHTFVSALHENYILSCESTGPMDLATPIDYVNDCIEHLSLSDLLCPSRDVFFGGRAAFPPARDAASHLLRQDDMAFHVAVGGLLLSLPSPVRRRPPSAARAARAADAFRMFYPSSLKLWRAKEETAALVAAWSARALGGDAPDTALTDGASAFRRPAAPSAAARRRAPRDSAAPPPLLSLGCAARHEMLLERLPYMAHMARARPSARLGDLERIVAFHGPAAAADDDDDDAAAADAAAADVEPPPADAWATDRPADDDAAPRRPTAGIRAAAVSGLLAQKLVLSDDDIED